MREAEWLACADPKQMLEVVWRAFRSRVTDRKEMLFCCGCVRRILSVLGDNELFGRAVEVAERMADGQADDEEHHDARTAVREGRRGGGPGEVWVPGEGGTWVQVEQEWDEWDDMRHHAEEAVLWMIESFPKGVIEEAVNAVGYMAITEYCVTRIEFEDAEAAESAAQAHLMRDIFGPLYRRRGKRAERQWNEPLVQQLATAAYDERVLPDGTLAPDRLGILADALEEAGSGDRDLLSHLRSQGPHVRGCWALDLVLGKN